MSVLVEALSVFVRSATLEARYPGGVAQYAIDCPNGTFCTDGVLTRVGFMDPSDAQGWITRLEQHGLQRLRDGASIDVAVVSQTEGFLGFCDWLEGGTVDGIGMVWLKGAPPGVFAAPVGWTPAQSRGMIYIPDDEIPHQVLDVGTRAGVEEALDMDSGRRLYLGRTHQLSNPAVPSEQTAIAGAQPQGPPDASEPDQIWERWQAEARARGRPSALSQAPAYAGPIGLAVKTAADLERVHNEVFGRPFRALGRALGFLARPDYKDLETRVQYDRATIQTIVADLRGLAGNEERQDSLSGTLNLLGALDQVAQRMVLLVRHYGGADTLPSSRAGRLLAEYKSALAFIDSYQPFMRSVWGPCRAREDAILVYFLRMIRDKEFDARIWDQIDPEFAAILRS